MTGEILFVLFLLMSCHWLADFTHLSTPYMLKAKSKGSPLLPIFSHACVHGFLMGIVLFFFVKNQNQLLLLIGQLILNFYLKNLLH